MLDSIKISNSKSQSENAKDRRDAVNQAVTESSENFEVVMTQDFQSIQNRYEGGMEEHERRVAELIESEARDAPRCQRSNLCMNIQFFFQAGEREEKFVKSQMHSELQSHIVCYRRSSHEQEVQQERMIQHWEHQEAQRRVQLQTEEVAKLLPISHPNEMSRATTACDSWKTVDLPKRWRKQSTKRVACARFRRSPRTSLVKHSVLWQY